MWARSWPAAPLKKLPVTKITEVAAVNGEEKDYLGGLLTKEENSRIQFTTLILSASRAER